MRLTVWLAGTSVLALVGCVGPVALHQAVLDYDEVVSRVQQEALLINIARVERRLPPHFTLTSTIAATFDYRTNAGIAGSLVQEPGPNILGLNLGVSVAENPTIGIVPMQGEEFTLRILAPMDEAKFEFLVFQGAPVDMVMRLMADGIELQRRDGTFERFILNWPDRPDEYAEFRRRALHLAWLNANRQLFVGPIVFEQRSRAALAQPPSASDVVGALERGYQWRRAADGVWELARRVSGRVAITNYDPRTLSDAERAALNARAAANPRNFVLVDIRPDGPGGDSPLFGALKLRSLNALLGFVAEGIRRTPEYDVAPDPRTGPLAPNPTRALTIEVGDARPPGAVPSVRYAGRFWMVADTPWDREAFTLLYQLFQMTVTDVSKLGIPVTISK